MGGPEAVERLDGCFSGIIVDEESRELLVVSDRLGQRTLRYLSLGGRLLVASHDLALVATGAVAPELDLVSAASVFSVGWSIGGAPLLAGVRRLAAGERLRFQDGRSQLDVHAPFARPAHRHPRDRTDVNRRMLCAIGERVRRFASRRATVHCDLTAGLDSRVVWSMLAAVTQPEQRIAYTTGSSEGLEVTTAARIVSLTGGRHEVGPVPEVVAVDFARHLRALAVALNGDTSGKRALGRLPVASAPVRIGGGGGEIFRGYYASLADPKDRPEEAASKFLARRAPRLDALSPASQLTLNARVTAVFARHAEWSPHPSDWFEAFYALDRLGVWGRVATWRYWAPIWNPFACADAVELLFSLPVPSAHHVDLHQRALRQHFLRGYLMPTNGSGWPPLEGPGRLRARGRKLLKTMVKFTRRRGLLRGRELDVDELRARRLEGAVLENLREQALSSGGVASALIERPTLEALFARHLERRSELEALGALATLEAHQRLLREAAAG
jgi:hypothetical protein